ncbi:helix-turn-helix domain-containing protein [Streptomyces sp. NPDC006658]|uniref:helix-turn-helix transcriptional regulator n=1 Tax=Streptomyces sp. NPDC006658 TaxID=3156900 RepID=UPI0033E462FF
MIAVICDDADQTGIQEALMVRRRGLAERRVARGYSQEEFAALLGVATSTVVRWESGRSAPRPYQRPRMAELLGMSRADLDELLSSARTVVITSGSSPFSASLGDPGDMRRRDLLGLLTATSALLALPDSPASASPGRTSAVVPEAEEAVIGHLWRVYGLADDKHTLYPVVRRQLGSLAEEMEHARGDTGHRHVSTRIADLYQLAGELFFDARDNALSAHCYALAASAAREARAYDLWACALTRHAYVELYAGRAASAAALLSAASRIARRGDSALSTRHWVSAVHAEAHAALGDFDACVRALDAAEEVHALSGPVHNGGWLRFDGSRLAEERGACYVALGRPDLAEGALTSALTQHLGPRRRGAVLVDLAALGAHRRDVDQVVHYADEALAVAGQTRSGYVSVKLHGLFPRLAGLPADARVPDLHQRIAALPHPA